MDCHDVSFHTSQLGKTQFTRQSSYQAPKWAFWESDDGAKVFKNGKIGK